MKYWVIDSAECLAQISFDNKKLIMQNGLIYREIELINSNTISLKNLRTNMEYIDKSYCDTSVRICKKDTLIADKFEFHSVKKAEILKIVDYFPNSSMSEIREYPPKGKAVELDYISQELSLKITLHYEIYDGIPTIMKKVFVKNIGKDAVTIDTITTDILNVQNNRDMLFVDSNFNADMDILNNLIFESYAKMYARYKYDFLEISPMHLMNVKINANECAESITAYESVFTAEYFEQKMIEVKSIYRVLAPWILDTALFFHLISNNSKDICKAVDQCAEVGMEMIIQSFGSGVNMESDSKSYLKKIKKAYDYGHSKGLRMGAYTLAYVKNYRPVRGHEALNHDYSHICRCLANDWAKKYTKKVLNFIDATGADAIEIDGPYGMLLCSGGKTHHHKDFTDSQYHQWKHAVDDWYKEIRKRNVYINAPDWHYLNGTNRSGIGYEEIAFSEKRAEQLVTSRIYYYKGTFAKNPTMGWGFVPLSVYHGGGSDAKFSPTNINSFDYDWALAQVVASGVWPTLRGKSVYDSQIGKEILSKWVAIYKKYRQVLSGLTIHFMPPRIDKSNPTKTTCLDAIMNQLPYGDTRGFVMFFNQTDKVIKQIVNVPVYYTGCTDLTMPPQPFANCKNCDVEYPIYGNEVAPLVIVARDSNTRNYITDRKFEDKAIESLPQPTMTDKIIQVAKSDGNYKATAIDSNGNIQLEVELPAMSYCYYTMKA